MSLEQKPFKLGSVVVRPVSHQIEASHGTTTVEGRHMEALVYLAGRPGKVVSGEEIIFRGSLSRSCGAF